MNVKMTSVALSLTIAVAGHVMAGVATRPTTGPATTAASVSRPATSTAAISQPPIARLQTGSHLRNEAGRLILNSATKYPKFQFIKPKKGWPHAIYLLPCLALQAMESIHQPHIGFVLSGIVSQYHRRFYLLPDSDVRLLSPRGQSIASASEHATTRPITPEMAKKTTAQAVLHNLLSYHISRPVEQLVTIKPMLTAKPIPGLPSPAGTGAWPALPEGTWIWNRAGRLLYEQPLRQWLIVFQADSARLTQPPLILLPCMLLERMEHRSAKFGTEVQFKISGEITQFKGRNYLFITYVEAVHNLGRF